MGTHSDDITIKMGDKVIPTNKYEPQEWQLSEFCPICGDNAHTFISCTKFLSLQPNNFGYNLPSKTDDETFEAYWNRVKEHSFCSFCGEEGHSRKDCQTLRNNPCQMCGFRGHTPKKCNKIKKGPNGEVGRCTYCKGDKKWGHWIVTCPDREQKFGPFQFPEGTDVKRALTSIMPKRQ